MMSFLYVNIVLMIVLILTVQCLVQSRNAQDASTGFFSGAVGSILEIRQWPTTHRSTFPTTDHRTNKSTNTTAYRISIDTTFKDSFQSTNSTTNSTTIITTHTTTNHGAYRSAIPATLITTNTATNHGAYRTTITTTITTTDYATESNSIITTIRSTNDATFRLLHPFIVFYFRLYLSFSPLPCNVLRICV